MLHLCGTQEGQIMCQEQKIKGLRWRRERGENTPEPDPPWFHSPRLSSETLRFPPLYPYACLMSTTGHLPARNQIRHLSCYESISVLSSNLCLIHVHWSLKQPLPPLPGSVETCFTWNLHKTLEYFIYFSAQPLFENGAASVSGRKLQTEDFWEGAYCFFTRIRSENERAMWFNPA